MLLGAPEGGVFLQNLKPFLLGKGYVIDIRELRLPPGLDPTRIFQPKMEITQLLVIVSQPVPMIQRMTFCFLS